MSPRRLWLRRITLGAHWLPAFVPAWTIHPDRMFWSREEDDEADENLILATFGMVCPDEAQGPLRVTPITRYCRGFRAGTGALDGGAAYRSIQQQWPTPTRVAAGSRDAAHLPRQWRKADHQ